MPSNLKTIFSTLREAKSRPLPVKDAGSIKPSSIPRRAWLMQNRLLRKYVTCTIAPGGVGKTMLGTLECISLATGTSLTGYDVVERGNALLFNAEDPLHEMEMRTVAVADYFEIPMSELTNRLFLISGRDFRCRLVTFNKELDAYEVNHAVVNTLRTFISNHAISLMYLDPFIRIHDVPENDNIAIDKVAEVLTNLADELNCSVSIAHHSRKQGTEGGAGNQDTSRGASSLISAARIAHTLTAMTEKEARSYGIDPDRRNWYVRMDDAKVNLAPPADQITWFEKKSVEIANGESVGVLKRLELSKAEEVSQDDQICTLLEATIREDGYPLTFKDAVDLCITVLEDKRTPRVMEAAIRKAIEVTECKLICLQKGVKNSQNRWVNGIGLEES